MFHNKLQTEIAYSLATFRLETVPPMFEICKVCNTIQNDILILPTLRAAHDARMASWSHVADVVGHVKKWPAAKLLDNITNYGIMNLIGGSIKSVQNKIMMTEDQLSKVKDEV